MTKAQWREIKHFLAAEFDDPTLPGSGSQMDYDFVKRLDLLRSQWGIPIVINSGFRTIRHNALVGGKPNSAHTKGLAADCEVNGLTNCIRFAILAARHGFVRIGVDLHGRYVHIDADHELPQNVTWFYGAGAGDKT